MSVTVRPAADHRNLLGLQALRGLAACMVIVHHASQSWSGQATGISDAPGWTNGAAGVDIFFVVSGVVMMLTVYGGSQGVRSARQFLKRRLIRLVPLYWILTALYLLKSVVIHRFPQWENSREHVATPIGYILASCFFVPYRNAAGMTQPLLSQGWTLEFEMFFYILFAAALALRIAPLRFLTPILVALALVGWQSHPDWPSIAFLASPLLLEFLAGVFIGYLLRSGYSLAPKISTVIGLLALTCLLLGPGGLHSSWWRLAWGAEASSLVLATVLLERHIRDHLARWVLLIGDASYSIYLSHLFTFTFGLKLLNRMGLLGAGRDRLYQELLSIAVLVVLSVLVGILIYRTIESPINDTLRRKLGTRAVQVKTADAAIGL